MSCQRMWNDKLLSVPKELVAALQGSPRCPACPPGSSSLPRSVMWGTGPPTLVTVILNSVILVVIWSQSPWLCCWGFSADAGFAVCGWRNLQIQCPRQQNAIICVSSTGAPLFFFVLLHWEPCLAAKVNYNLRLLCDSQSMQNLIVRMINIWAVKLLPWYKLCKVCWER